jgi:hypothetical protein
MKFQKYEMAFVDSSDFKAYYFVITITEYPGLTSRSFKVPTGAIYSNYVELQSLFLTWYGESNPEISETSFQEIDKDLQVTYHPIHHSTFYIVLKNDKSFHCIHTYSFAKAIKNIQNGHRVTKFSTLVKSYPAITYYECVSGNNRDVNVTSTSEIGVFEIPFIVNASEILIPDYFTLNDILDDADRPKINFTGAVAALNNGQSIRRKSWPEGNYLLAVEDSTSLQKKPMMFNNSDLVLEGMYIFPVADTQADDYEIYVCEVKAEV